MKKYVTVKNLSLLTISLIISSFLAIVLGMTIMFPILIVAILALGIFDKKGKVNWESAIATISGGIIIQIFLLL